MRNRMMRKNSILYFVIIVNLIEQVYSHNANIVRNEIRTLSSGRRISISYGKFERFNNKRLIGNLIKRVYYDKEGTCKSNCAATHGCVSINTKEEGPDIVQCEMLDTDHLGKENLLVNSTDTNYFTVKVNGFTIYS